MRIFGRLRRRRRTAAIALLCAAIAAAPMRPAQAIDVDPGDFVPLPKGTNLAILYGILATRSQFTARGGTDVRGSNLNSQIGLLRYVYYNEVAGMPIVLQGILPFGALNGGRVGGAPLDSTEGVGDPILSAVIWPVSQPDRQRWLGLAYYIGLPIGSYNANQPLNLGNNRFVHTLQAGFVQGFGPQWFGELSVDAVFYGDNDRVGAARQTLSQTPSFQIQPWVRYVPVPGQSISLGYAGTAGGLQELDGTSNGGSAIAHTLRAAYQNLITPTVQLEGLISGDVAVSGGFRRDVQFQLRIVKIF